MTSIVDDLTAAATQPRKVGRQPVAGDPRQRERHLKVAARKVLKREPAPAIARRYKISLRTVFLWVDLALSYDDPRAQMLRAIAESN